MEGLNVFRSAGIVTGILVGIIICLILFRYMNRDKKDFENNYTLWLQVMRDARLMNSYYRTERTFDKSMQFEL